MQEGGGVVMQGERRAGLAPDTQRVPVGHVSVWPLRQKALRWMGVEVVRRGERRGEGEGAGPGGTLAAAGAKWD